MLKPKIRVLFTIPNFDTAGSGRALLNIASGLDKNQFESHIMCKHESGSFFKTVKETGIPVHIHDYESKMRPISNGLINCWKVSRVFKKVDPDIIHSFHYLADYSEALAARMAGCTWIFTKKNMNWGGSSKNGWLLRSQLAKKIAVQNTDMISAFYANDQKAVLIPRGVNCQMFDRNLDAVYQPGKKRIVVCVANLVPVKGIEILIQAFSRICESTTYKDWHIKIVGDDLNEYGRKLKTLYRDLIVKKRLVFTGRVLDVKSELESCEIFVLPTLNEGRMEGSPVSLLEAMSMGLIPLGSRIPGIKDQLGPLNEEFLFDPGCVDDLAEKLRKFMAISNDELITLGRKVRNYCRENWNISIEIKRHEQLYFSLVKDASRVERKTHAWF